MQRPIITFDRVHNLFLLRKSVFDIFIKRLFRFQVPFKSLYDVIASFHLSFKFSDVFIQPFLAFHTKGAKRNQSRIATQFLGKVDYFDMNCW